MGSVDAFSRAILDEKDPIVRGYMENLRAQIATIAAKHGANARDVWNKEVQDRMSVDELDAVNARFAKIKTVAEKKWSRDVVRGMEDELSEKESAAQKMLDEALGLPDLSLQTYEDIGRLFLDAGMVAKARVLYENFPGQDDAYEIELYLAQAAEIPRDVPAPDYLRNYLEKAMRLARQYEEVNIDSENIGLTVYDAYLPVLSDQQLWKETDARLEKDSLTPYPAKAARLAFEFERRGLSPMESMREISAQATDFLHEEFDFDEKVNYFLQVAEFRAKHGFDPKPSLEQAIANAKGLDFSALESQDLVGKIIQTAAKLGQFDLVDSMVANPWWPSNESMDVADKLDVRDVIVLGCVNGGNLEKSLEVLRAKPDERNFHFHFDVDQVAQAFLNQNDIRRADEVIAELDPEQLDEFRRGIKHIAARARRGDDVLAEARVLADEHVVDHPMLKDLAPTNYGTKAWYLASAAIATIWNAREMKKRIAEYAKKR